MGKTWAGANKRGSGAEPIPYTHQLSLEVFPSSEPFLVYCEQLPVSGSASPEPSSGQCEQFVKTPDVASSFARLLFASVTVTGILRLNLT